MPIEYVKEGHIATFTINNPEVMNALTPTQVAEWTDALIDFRDDKNMWVGIVTGAGDRAFCTGLNLRSAGQTAGGEARPIPKETLVRGLKLYKPLIAAINGYALGGGLEIALACDIRVASENAQLGLTEVTLGLLPGWGGTQRLPRLVPFAVAADMMIMGRRVKADEALAIRLVHEVVPLENLMETAKARAEKIAESAPLAVQGVKEAMLRGIEMSLEDGLALERELGRTVNSSKDFAEGMKAFAEKRKPNYTGE
ncbi:MAG: enoyl-CoA hydratase/isomerase family protein [Dehalococcoidales bacterium]|nr:MAG: enoyl-CoA hydratase/isomerase family protein [Dehalococcoidales bacterium]